MSPGEAPVGGFERRDRSRGWPAHVREAGRFVWPLLQGTGAATAAWVIAKHVLGHPEPFFAPVAAIIALNASLGERGLNAVRLMKGVVVGILVGEVALGLLGSGWGVLALATFIATAIARATGGLRIVVAQAAVSAILTVTVADAAAGLDRLVDALVGAGVALVFSQLLFSPEPVGLVRRAAAAALQDMAEGLELTAEAMEQDSDELGDQALGKLRMVRDRLVELARTRQAGTRIVRRSAVWRSQRPPVVREIENAGHLDLLGGSCLMLVRACVALTPTGRRDLTTHVRDLASALADLAEEPGDRPTRQRAADRALGVARRCAGPKATLEPSSSAALVFIDVVAMDVMVFAGADPAQAEAAVLQETGVLEVPAPPPAPRVPFRRNRSSDPRT